MSPHEDWFQGVMLSCRRCPHHTIFTGPTYIVWPSVEVSKWARRGRIHGWAFSVAHTAKHDEEIVRGEWATPNHFWIRSLALSGGRRFADLWATEPQFLLALAADGHRSMRCPNPAAGHRIQPELLEKSVIRSRARQVGCSFADVALRQPETRPGELFRKYPLLTRLFCLANALAWSVRYGLASLHPSADTRFINRVSALERLNYFCQILRIARAVEAERDSRPIT